MAGLPTSGRTVPGLSLWNGADPILKERMFGLTGRRATMARTSRSTGGTWTGLPSHALLAGATTTRRRRSPTSELIDENARGGPGGTEYELTTPASSTTTVLDRRCGLRQGGADRSARRDDRREPRPGRGDASMSCPRCGSATRGGGPPDRRCPSCALDGDTVVVERPPARRVPARGGNGTGRQPPSRGVLRQRDEHRPAVRRRAAHGVPEGRHQRPRRPGADTVNPEDAAPRRPGGTT